jgi:hypothetical protein
VRSIIKSTERSKQEEVRDIIWNAKWRTQEEVAVMKRNLNEKDEKMWYLNLEVWKGKDKKDDNLNRNC